MKSEWFESFLVEMVNVFGFGSNFIGKIGAPVWLKRHMYHRRYDRTLW